MDSRTQRAVTRAVAALESVTDARARADAALAVIAEARRVRREAFAELKKDHSFAEIGKMFGITGSRVDQIMREGRDRQSPAD
jgi:DNA-directed RNA polymerase sigma subunit (sigma70/sigma32)